jgi:hypothetical protein
MKSILKALFIAALSGVLFDALLRKLAAEAARAGERHGIPDEVPTLNPVRDAEPTVEEPLQDGDLRVAQNTPL